MQDKSKLGKRFQCFQCGLKFYDLNRPEPLCPKCGADQRENPNPDPREAILARFKGKGGMTKGAAREDFEAEDEEVESEDADADEADEIEDEDEDLGESAEVEEED
ncbi:MAG: FYDLN acid domain-containing protein [Pseudomonadota bacterium]|nr:FYDLN acid domain-containing protein [Pseudomonadota bacterium]